MPGSVEHRSVTPLIKYLRIFLRGRDHTNALRFADLLAARTQPPPNIPGGPYHKSSKIYYFTRDARREIAPPTLIADSSSKQIGAGSEVAAKPKLATPGKVWKWD